MSELQAALLVIGFGAIVAVYAFGWWQQRLYRRKFGAAFKSGHADALYREHPGKGMGGSASLVEEAIDEAIHVGNKDALNNEGQGKDAWAKDITLPAAEPSSITVLNESCGLLDGRCDFIIELQLDEPGPAAVLDGLWQRKFDFGKPVLVCGLTLGTKKWERVIAESKTLYARLRLALQLVDRGGAISEAKLADFRDLVLGVAKQIKAELTVPDLSKTHQRAAELDAFCAGVDQMVGVNLVPPNERLLSGRKIAQAAALLGMTLESDGAFHLLDTHGNSLFSLINRDSKPFLRNALDGLTTDGITLLMDVPRVENPALQFDMMVRIASELAGELNVELVDDHLVVLNNHGLTLIRAQIAGVEAKMCEHGIKPGGAQARRLFS